MNPLQRLAIAAFLADLALYLIMLALPFEALRMGATPLVLGIVPALYAGTYSVTAYVAGHSSDRWSRRRFAMVGASVAAIFALLLGRASTLFWLLACVPGIGLGLGFYWAPVQASLPDAAPASQLERSVSLFNLSWSAGKGLGLLVGGLLLSRIGVAGISLLAAAAFFAASALRPALDRPVAESENITPEPSPRSGGDSQRRRRFRQVAWLANGVTFGVAATFNHQYPKWLVNIGLDAESFGLFLGGVFLVQTATFAFLGRSSRWHDRALPLIGSPLIVAALALLLPELRTITGLLLLALPLGICLGFNYMSSLYYSLHTADTRGGHAGIHEAVLGMFSVVLPFAAGIGVQLSGSLRAPYILVAAALLIPSAVAAQRLLPRSS